MGNVVPLQCVHWPTVSVLLSSSTPIFTPSLLRFLSLSVFVSSRLRRSPLFPCRGKVSLVFLPVGTLHFHWLQLCQAGYNLVHSRPTYFFETVKDVGLLYVLYPVPAMTKAVVWEWRGVCRFTLSYLNYINKTLAGWHSTQHRDAHESQHAISFNDVRNHSRGLQGMNSVGLSSLPFISKWLLCLVSWSVLFN